MHVDGDPLRSVQAVGAGVLAQAGDQRGDVGRRDLQRLQRGPDAGGPFDAVHARGVPALDELAGLLGVGDAGGDEAAGEDRVLDDRQHLLAGGALGAGVQLGAPAGLLEHAAGHRVVPQQLGQVVGEVLGAAGEGGDGVVELVGDAGGELAEGGHARLGDEVGAGLAEFGQGVLELAVELGLLHPVGLRPP